MARYVSSHRARGICDRCGFAYRLSTLKPEYVRGKNNGLLVCRECWDDDHPQNFIDYVETADAQVLMNPRPEDNRQSRAIRWDSPPATIGRIRTRVGKTQVGVQ